MTVETEPISYRIKLPDEFGVENTAEFPDGTKLRIRRVKPAPIPDCRYWRELNAKQGKCGIHLVHEPTHYQCQTCTINGKRSRGIGDTITRVLWWLSFGLVAGFEKCGCGRRQSALNILIPYRRKKCGCGGGKRSKSDGNGNLARR